MRVRTTSRQGHQDSGHPISCLILIMISGALTSVIGIPDTELDIDPDIGCWYIELLHSDIGIPDINLDLEFLIPISGI